MTRFGTHGPWSFALTLVAAALLLPAPTIGTDGTATPVAQFDWDPTGPGVGQLVRFRDLSTDTDDDITSWHWTFDPDGDVCCNQPNPTHVWSEAGSMTVTLTVTDAEGHTATKEVELVVRLAPEAPVATFTWNPDRPSTSETVVFHDTSTDPDGTVRQRHWDFGDGNESTEQDPVHRYASPGNYLVTLTVTDDEDNEATVQHWVTVRNTAPFADIRFRPREPLEGDEISFTSRSRDADGDPLIHAWDLGDGNTSNATSLTHTFAEAGTYEVTLTVEDPHGATDTTTDTVVVQAAPAALGGSLPAGELQELVDDATGGSVELPSGTFRETLAITDDLHVIGDATIVDGGAFPALLVTGGTVRLEELTLRSSVRALQLRGAELVELVNVTVDGGAPATAEDVRLVRWWTPAGTEPEFPEMEGGLAVHGHFVEVSLLDADGAALNDTAVTLVEDGVETRTAVTDANGRLGPFRIAHRYTDGNATGTNTTALAVEGSSQTYELDAHDASQLVRTDVQRGGSDGLPTPSAPWFVLVLSLLALAAVQRRPRRR